MHEYKSLKIHMLCSKNVTRYKNINIPKRVLHNAIKLSNKQKALNASKNKLKCSYHKSQEMHFVFQNCNNQYLIMHL